MTQPTTSGPGSSFTPSTPDAPESLPASPKPQKSSLFDDFLDIFYAPSAVFARRANLSSFIPIVILTVLLGVIAFVNRDIMEPIMDAEMARAMAARGQQLTPEQIEASKKFTGVIGTIGPFVFAPLMMLGTGIVLWLVGMIVGSKATLNAAIAVSTFSFVPRVVEGIVNRVQGLMVDPSSLDGRFSLSLGLGRFLDPDTTAPALLALVGRIDLFTLWVTVLLAIGLAVTGKISRGKAAVAAAIVWLVGGLPAIIPALMQ